MPKLQENLKQVQRLIKISTPNKLPVLQPETVLAPQKADKKSFLPLFGERSGFKKKVDIRKVIVEQSWKIDTGDADEPESDEENQVDDKNAHNKNPKTSLDTTQNKLKNANILDLRFLTNPNENLGWILTILTINVNL